MKNITKENRMKIIQITFAVIAFGFYITYSALINPVARDLGHYTKWLISRVIYAMPYIVCLLSITFGRYKNPRRLSSISIAVLFLSFIPSYLGLTIFPPLVLVENCLSYKFSITVMSILLLIGFILLLALPDIKKSIFTGGLTTISVVSFSFAMSKIYIAEGMASLNMIAFSCLMFAIALFGTNFNYGNEYEPQYYKWLGIDRNKYLYFDYIVDGITDSYLTDSLYPKALAAREFYYAIKKDDKEKLAELNITGKDNIASIFALWLKFEKDYYSDREPTIFFNLCKYMTSNKISDKDFNRAFYLFRQAVCTQKNVFGTIDISIKGEEPVNILSPLYDETFEYDNTVFASVESFFQGLKFKDSKRQAEIFAMPGKAAKKAGRYHNWWKLTGNLYFKGKKINRYSFDYDKFIAVPFLSKFCNDDGKFKQALLDTKFKTLTYSKVKTEKYQTVLTQSEYLNILNFVKRKAFDECYLNENTTEDYNE